MKEMLESKVLIGVVVFILIFIYINAIISTQKNDSIPTSNESQFNNFEN